MRLEHHKVDWNIIHTVDNFSNPAGYCGYLVAVPKHWANPREPKKMADSGGSKPIVKIHKAWSPLFLLNLFVNSELFELLNESLNS